MSTLIGRGGHRSVCRGERAVTCQGSSPFLSRSDPCAWPRSEECFQARARTTNQGRSRSPQPVPYFSFRERWQLWRPAGCSVVTTVVPGGAHLWCPQSLPTAELYRQLPQVAIVTPCQHPTWNHCTGSMWYIWPCACVSLRSTSGGNRARIPSAGRIRASLWFHPFQML